MDLNPVRLIERVDDRDRDGTVGIVGGVRAGGWHGSKRRSRRRGRDGGRRHVCGGGWHGLLGRLPVGGWRHGWQRLVAGRGRRVARRRRMLRHAAGPGVVLRLRRRRGVAGRRRGLGNRTGGSGLSRGRLVLCVGHVLRSLRHDRALVRTAGRTPGGHGGWRGGQRRQRLVRIMLAARVLEQLVLVDLLAVRLGLRGGGHRLGLRGGLAAGPVGRRRRLVGGVMRAQRGLDRLREGSARGDRGRLTDDVALVRDPDVAGARRGVLEGDQGRATTEAAFLDEQPLGSTGPGIDPDVLEPADACAIDIVDLRADPARRPR